MWGVPLVASPRRALRPSFAGAVGRDPAASVSYADGLALDDLMLDAAAWRREEMHTLRSEELAARSADIRRAEELRLGGALATSEGLHALRSAELAARSADSWRTDGLRLGGALATSAAGLRALALEDESLAVRGGAIRSQLDGALTARGLAEEALHLAGARTGRANLAVNVGQMELKSSTEMLEKATEGFSTAHASSCDAETAHHRALELLANREAIVPDLAVRVREAHKLSQEALRRQATSADDQKDAERIFAQAESEENDSQRTLQECQREFETAVSELEGAVRSKAEAGKRLGEARRGEVDASRTVNMATQELVRSEEAKQLVKSLAIQADATATFAESQSQLRLAKFPPDPEGVQYAQASRASQQRSHEQSDKAEKEFDRANQRLVQKRDDLEYARGLLERAEANYHDTEQKGLACAAEVSKRKMELEAAKGRHEEAASLLAGAKAALARANKFHRQEAQLYLDRKTHEDKLSDEQAAAQTALENAKKAAAAAAENLESSRLHLSESASQLHLSRKRADNARLGASTNRGNQAWSAVAEKQERLHAMLAADHGLALQERWALHRASHGGVLAARAAALEKVADEERALARAARNAAVAAAESAELDLRADVVEQEAALLGVPPIARSVRRWQRARPASLYGPSPVHAGIGPQRSHSTGALLPSATCFF